MKFELHCHSWYSKGKKITWEAIMSPEQIVRNLKKKGFTGVAITDHDTIDNWKDAKKAAKKHDFVFIPGLEVTSKSGHILGLGLNEDVKSGLTIEETVERIREQGGISIAPHPFDLRNEGIGREFTKCDAAEVFNSLLLSRLENGKSSKMIRKSGIPGVGGSDAHCPGMLGMTVNHIEADDVDGVLRQIKKGKVRVDGRYTPVPVVVSWARERMRWSYDDIVKYVDKNYSAPKAAFSKFMLKRFVNSDSVLWDGLGYFSVGVSVLYSAIKSVRR